MKNIFIPLDLKPNSREVVDQGATIAKAFGAVLWLEHVAAPDPEFAGYEAGPQYIRDIRADALRDEHRTLQRMADGLREQGITAHALLINGPTAETILNEAARLNADLIVLGAHGRHGIAKAFMGSVCSEVLRTNRFRVLVVPSPQL